MVEIIRMPNEQNPPVDVTCKCTAVMRFKKSEGIYMTDQRDGDAYVFQCPLCHHDNWVAASIIK